MTLWCDFPWSQCFLEGVLLGGQWNVLVLLEVGARGNKDLLAKMSPGGLAGGRGAPLSAMPLPQVPQVPDQEVPKEEQPAGLAACGGQQQGELRAALLPDQPG